MTEPVAPGSVLAALLAAALFVASCGTAGTVSPTPAPTPRASAPAERPSPPGFAPQSTPTATPVVTVSPWRVTLDIKDGSPIDLAFTGNTVYLTAQDGILVSEQPGDWGDLVRPEDVAAAVRVAAGPEAAVATGLIVPGDAEARAMGEHPAAAWVLDGERWRLAPISAPLTDLMVHDVAWDGTSFVAVGVAACSPRWFQALVEPAVRLASSGGDGGLGCPEREGYLPMRWVSRDGRSWTADPDPAEHVGEIGAIAVGHGGAVAAGYLGDEVSATTPTVWWRRADGRWEVQMLPAEGSGGVADIELLGDAALAVGGDASGPVAWLSQPDGTWQRSQLDFPAGTLAPIPGGVLAMGLEMDEEWEPVRTVLAVTRDGVTWTRLPDDPALARLEPADIVVMGERVVLAAAEPGARVLEADASGLGLLPAP